MKSQTRGAGTGLQGGQRGARREAEGTCWLTFMGDSHGLPSHDFQQTSCLKSSSFWRPGKDGRPQVGSPEAAFKYQTVVLGAGAASMQNCDLGGKPVPWPPGCLLLLTTECQEIREDHGEGRPWAGAQRALLALGAEIGPCTSWRTAEGMVAKGGFGQAFALYNSSIKRSVWFQI